MVGVVDYARPCQVCPREDRAEVEAAILARLGDTEIANGYPNLSPYAVRQHRHKCLPKMLRGGRGVSPIEQMHGY